MQSRYKNYQQKLDQIFLYFVINIGITFTSSKFPLAVNEDSGIRIIGKIYKFLLNILAGGLS
jgi:hypothetical protein